MKDGKRPFRALLAAAELYPLMKTGGLADVVHSLADSLAGRGLDVKVVLPGYGDTLAFLDDALPTATARVALDTSRELELHEYRFREVGYGVYLVKQDALFGRAGTPYMDELGVDWPDNALRFGLFCKVAAALARGKAGVAWCPDVIHCHDWHAALIPVWLTTATPRPATVFTIHTAAYQGVFGRDAFDELALDARLWSVDGLEFFGGWSFLKGGLMFSDRLVAVSPGYARELLTPQYGCGMEGILRQRRTSLEGILNGVDYRVWHPSRDRFVATRFSRENIADKLAAKHSLQREFGLPVEPPAFLVAHVGRLTDQKGIDVLLQSLPQCLANQRLQVIVLGAGEYRFERALREAAQRYPKQLGVHIGFSEPLAHRIVAGADAFVMPSRFEPCGLTQMYSLAYGTVPVVHATGGLADTVIDASAANIANGTATGFWFAELGQLSAAIERAYHCFDRSPEVWSQIMQTGMCRDFGWDKSAQSYIEVYQKALRVAEARA